MDIGIFGDESTIESPDFCCANNNHITIENRTTKNVGATNILYIWALVSIYSTYLLMQNKSINIAQSAMI
jgi:hypothetical protein